jgi:hypothetical protein
MGTRIHQLLTRLALGDPRADPPVARLVLIVAGAGAIYGACMGGYSLHSPERWLLVPIAAIKVPLLLLVTALVCLPAFFVLNSVCGLRRDFPDALRAVVAAQAVLALALASLGPITRFAYACGIDHREAILFSAIMFTLATIAGHRGMLARYRVLITRGARHRIMLWAWVMMYAFVGIQMGWLLRPFVGSPDLPPALFRDEAFTNAYVALWRIIAGE